jgi:3-oxoacyl-[acyl-carrier protein] reductase
MAMNNLFSLAGDRILLTGAAGGIGSATARVCASLGAELILVDRHSSEALARELSANGTKTTSITADTTDRQTVEKIVASAEPLDAVVDCAGRFITEDWLTDSDWDESCREVLEINVLAPLNLARAVMPRMMERKKGRIVLLGSVAGRNGGAARETQAHYAASKGAVHSMVRWLSRRAAPHGVNVNGLAPGPVDTPMNAPASHNLDSFPMRRLGRPEEIAWPAAFLCSRAASYMSGAILDVNGGVWVG